MTLLPWAPIETAREDGRPVFVWVAFNYRWATFRVPAFFPEEVGGSKTWCDGGMALDPQPTHWLDLSPPVAVKEGEEFIVNANCWRRGPEGSIACYSIEQWRPWTRCYEHEGSDTVPDEIAEAVAQSIVQQLTDQLYPKMLYAVRSAQGVDPDRRPKGQVPDA